MKDECNWYAKVSWDVPAALTVLHPVQLKDFMSHGFCDRAALFNIEPRRLAVAFALEAGDAEMAAWKAVGIVRNQLRRYCLPPLRNESVEVKSQDELQRQIDGLIAEEELQNSSK